MATHSSILAWKISWGEEPGGMQPMGSQRVGHNWATNTYLEIYAFFTVFSIGRFVWILIPKNSSPWAITQIVLVLLFLSPSCGHSPKFCAWPLLLPTMSSSCWKSSSYIGWMLHVSPPINISTWAICLYFKGYVFNNFLFIKILPLATFVLVCGTIVFPDPQHLTFIVHLPVNSLVHPPQPFVTNVMTTPCTGILDAKNREGVKEWQSIALFSHLFSVWLASGRCMMSWKTYFAFLLTDLCCFWTCRVTWGIFVRWPEIEPGPQ